MKLVIVRHADPDYSIDSLTPTGWKEAELLSERLVKLRQMPTRFRRWGGRRYRIPDFKEAGAHC